MPSEQTVPPALRVGFTLVRWAIIGTAAAVGFGVVLGLLIGVPKGSIDVAIGGVIIGLAGGPVFGVAIGLASRPGTRRAWKVREFALAGAVVFGLVPFAIGFVRDGEILAPEDRVSEVASGLLFLAGAGGTFGAAVGLAMRGRAAESERSHRNGWSELEL